MIQASEPITDTEHQERMWRLAKAETERDDVWSHRDCKTLSQTNSGVCDMRLTDGSMVKNTTDCHGTGRVPLLPGVRRKCSSNFSFNYQGAHPAFCTCHGLGYVPSNDPMVWARALRTAFDSLWRLSPEGGPWLQDYTRWRVLLADGDELAALEAAERALIEGGVIEP